MKHSPRACCSLDTGYAEAVAKRRTSLAHPYRLGARLDSRARAWLTQSRLRWVVLAFLCYSLFEVTAPYAALAQPAYARILEGVGVALAVVLIARLAVRRTPRD